jgi:sugar transferase EpsL
VQYWIVIFMVFSSLKSCRNYNPSGICIPAIAGKMIFMAAKLFPIGIPILKRIFDFVLTIPGIILISPFILVIAVILWIRQGTPLIFSQLRPGYRGEIFKIYKFRTMRNTLDKQGNLLPDRDRLTRIGTFLRSTSLDELPELINVLRGEMSLVGPRPLLIQYLPRYSKEQARRHDVLPGMAGWAQVNGRNAISWEEKFRLDVWYVDHWSLWLDIRILAMTFKKVIRREGISAPGEATAREFMGSEEKFKSG